MNYQLAGALSTAVVALIGLYVYKRRAGVDIDKKREDTKIDLDARVQAKLLESQAAAVRLLEAELGKRERELHELREQDRAEREQYIKTLLAIKTAIEVIASDLSAHRTEEKDRSGALHGRLVKMSNRLIVIETHLGISDHG